MPPTVAPIAHSRNERGARHDLVQHLEAVAEMAGGLACEKGYRASVAPQDVLDGLDLSAWQHFRGIGRVLSVLAHMFEELQGAPDYDATGARTVS